MKTPRSENVIAKYDRVGFISGATFQAARLKLRGSRFRVVSDHAFKNVNADFFHAPYGRVCSFIAEETRTRVFVKYKPRFKRLAAIRVDVVPDDRKGLTRPELEATLRAFAPFWLVVVEIALDFSKAGK